MAAGTATTEYASALSAKLQLGVATEHTHRAALQTYLESFASDHEVVNEPKRSKYGAPDFSVLEVTTHGPLAVGHVEAKDIGISLGAVETTEQLERYRGAFENLVLTDYVEFRWYVNGEPRATAVLGAVDAGTVRVDDADAERVEALLRAFIGHSPAKITQARDLAERMATLTHIIRDVIVQSVNAGDASPTTLDLRAAVAEVLVPELSVPDFADMFAQTLAYGLFAARVNHTGANPFRRQDAAFEIPRTNPFLRRLFGLVSGPDLEDEAFSGLVDDLAQLLGQADMERVLRNFGQHSRRRDPIFHFYETFLAAYDPVVRERRGVYYTPEPVVSYIVRSADEVVREHFGRAGGLGDRARTTYEAHESEGVVERDSPEVLILDPATGTGTFLYAIVDSIRSKFRAENNAGRWSAYVRDQLLPRLIGFELLMAPYAVAHLKLGLQLAAQDLEPAERDEWAYDFGSDERLRVYMTNSLEEAVLRSQVLLGGFITDEANAAAEIKRDLPIMVVLGNPPYSGHSANASSRVVRKRRRGRVVTTTEPTFIGRLLEDYYKVDGERLREKTSKWLQDDYVKFIRFGQWRVEQTGRGVLLFITNHSYLDNPTFRGMRQQLVNGFSEIYLLDLHGNQRKRERPPDGGSDQNIFEIQQGVAIGIFIKDGDTARPARVYHADLWGPQAAKYEWLDEHSKDSTAWTEIEPEGPLYLFKPINKDLQQEYNRGWRVDDIFPHHGSGMTTARDHVVVDFDDEALIERAKFFRDSPKSATAVCSALKIPAKRGWDAKKARELLRNEALALSELVQPVLYRPFDERRIFYHDSLVWRTSKAVTGHMLVGENVALAVGRAGAVIGADEWDIAFVSTAPTDFNLFRRGGNNLYPLYLYDGGGNGLTDQLQLHRTRVPNVSSAFVEACSQALELQFVNDGQGDLEGTFGPDDVLAYVYGILSAHTYRWRYEPFLRNDLPRIPLTNDKAVFTDVTRLGRQLVALHTGAEVAVPTLSFPVPGDNVVASAHPKYLAPGELEPGGEAELQVGRVYISPDTPRKGIRGQFFEGVTPEQWGYSVGGYQVIEKWLKDRRGHALTDDDFATFDALVGAAAETLRLMEELDEALGDWPLPGQDADVADTTPS
jgi:hypothetical protein